MKKLIIAILIIISFAGIIFGISIALQPGESLLGVFIIIGAALLGAAGIISGVNDAYDLIGKITGNKLGRQRNNDKETLEALSNILNKDGMISYIRDRDMIGSHSTSIHGYMDEFHEFCHDPRNIFVDNKLKQYQKQLDELIDKFNHYLASRSVPGNQGVSLLISSKGSYYDNLSGDPEGEYQEVSNELSQMADDIWETYSELISHAKETL